MTMTVTVKSTFFFTRLSGINSETFVDFISTLLVPCATTSISMALKFSASKQRQSAARYNRVTNAPHSGCMESEFSWQPGRPSLCFGRKRDLLYLPETTKIYLKCR